MLIDHDPTPDDDFVARIDAMPINAAHRDEARAHYVQVEREIGETMGTVAAMIDGTATSWREAFARRRTGVAK